MNYILITKTLIIFSFFSCIGLSAGLMADHFSSNPPTEESYLNSEYYEKTKMSYNEAMILYDNHNYSLGMFGLIMPIIGIIVSILYYYVLSPPKNKSQ